MTVPVAHITWSGIGYNALDLDGAGWVDTPDHASLDITGDLDLRVLDVAATDWTTGGAQGLLSKWSTPGNQRSWEFTITGSGFPQLRWSTLGTSGSVVTEPSTVAVPVADGVTVSLRVTLDVDDGAGNHVVTYYSSTDHGASWSVLDTVTTAGAASVFAGSAPVTIGSGFNGRIGAVEARDGIGGTVVASPDFRVRPLGSTAFADSAGRTWTFGGDAAVEFVSTPLGADFGAWVVRRYQEAIPGRFEHAGWFVIARILDEGTTQFDDHECRRGVQEQYQVLAEDADGVLSVPDAAIGVTMPAGTELVLTSNTDPSIDQQVLAILPLEFTYPRLSVTAHALGTYGQQVHHSGENLGRQLSLRLDVADGATAGPAMWEELVATLARTDLPYICVLDPFGNRYFARFPEQSASMPFYLAAEIGVPFVEHTDTPTVVVVP